LFNFNLFNARFISQKKHSCFTVAIIALFVMLSNSNVYGQLKNFGTKAKYKPEPNYHYSVYGYYDVIRESGVGFQFQIGNLLNLDVSGYLINKQNNLGGLVKQWDYYDLTGYGFSLKPKYLLGRFSRLYIGPNVAYEVLHHDKVWVENYSGRGALFIDHYLQDARGTAYTIGFTFGSKINYKQMFLEPFFGLGSTSAKLIQTTYDRDNKAYYPIVNYPIVNVVRMQYFQINLGIKLGFSFKKSKKHEAIDKKFDEVYIPKALALGAYFKTHDLSGWQGPRHLKRALARYKALNRNALRAYRLNYFDSTGFYNKMDFLFDRIDGLIHGKNEQNP
jgi:hypothetical protein